MAIAADLGRPGEVFVFAETDVFGATEVFGAAGDDDEEFEGFGADAMQWIARTRPASDPT
jgi:hypothetical protein